MISKLPQVLHLVDSYSEYLHERNVPFNALGFPLLDRSCFLNEWPTVVVPYKERLSSLVADEKATVLCFYCSETLLYPRLERVLADLNTYRKFMGVVGMDITVTEDMDLEWQEEIMLLNQLFTAILAVNDVKVLANLRAGSKESLECLDSIPKGVMCASGTLGCNLTSSSLDMRYAHKLMRTLPSKLLLYGRKDAVMEQQATTLGVPIRRYSDAHTLRKNHRKTAMQSQRLPSS